MVLSRVDSVRSNHVGAQCRKEGNILLTPRLVGQRVDVGSVACRGAGRSAVLLVGDALEVELCAVLVEELGALGEIQLERIAVG